MTYLRCICGAKNPIWDDGLCIDCHKHDHDYGDDDYGEGYDYEEDDEDEDDEDEDDERGELKVAYCAGCSEFFCTEYDKDFCDKCGCRPDAWLKLPGQPEDGVPGSGAKAVPATCSECGMLWTLCFDSASQESWRTCPYCDQTMTFWGPPRLEDTVAYRVRLLLDAIIHEQDASALLRQIDETT